MEKEYYVGLDVGTDSIGWAVTDTAYRLIKKRGQDLWGVYLFDKAQTAADRRAHRSARRRIARTHQRLMLLQELFSEEISKIDRTFFIRLKNSALHVADKDGRLQGKDALFSDPDFTDKDFHKRFPTVYHLRNHLLHAPAEDLRLLYLALHHVIKNRGHFLFEGQNFDAQDTQSVKTLFSEINAYYAEEERPCFASDRLDEALRILKDKAYGVAEKQKRLKEALGAGKEKHLLAAVKAMSGGKVGLKALYGEDAEEIDVAFGKENFDEEVLPSIEASVGDDVCLIRSLKAIYDWSVLSSILGEEKFLSSAKIKIYEKHGEDLKKLKALVRAQDPDGSLYKKIFKRQEKCNNYAAYVGVDGGKGFGKCAGKEFYDFLKKTLSLDAETEGEIEKGTFLPKQVNSGNGVIPYQVHLAELKRMLQVSAEKYPFLQNEEEGITVAEKIESLLTFRIPYYVGPLHSQNGHKFSWSKRMPGYERVSVTPWNFDRAVDKGASEEGFIRRMTNKCTYLVGEDVLPESSLLYSEFTFLNELNHLKINGRSLPEAKRLIYEYARKNKKVSLAKCLTLLKENGLVEKTAKKEEVFSGIDGDFHTSMAPYVVFREVLGDRVDTDARTVEEIIERITLMSSDKARLEQTLKARFGTFLSAEEIKRIKGFNFSKWGRLSEKLLTQTFSQSCCDENGSVRSVMDVMRAECKDLMQVLYEYGFIQSVEEYNDAHGGSEKVTYQTVEDLYCSPAVKRAIWRTLDLVKEIVKIMGRSPENIFVETARDREDNGKKGKRTVSRKQKLLDLYRSIKEEESRWKEEIEKTEETKFNSKKLMLYYLQKGRSMYSGKPIAIEDVFHTDVCDIDHVFPQSKIKDDSFDNTVLVYKTENAEKGDDYPVSAEIQARMAETWKTLKAQGFLSEKKHERLTRKTPLTQDELADFINRQLVETRQSTKEIASLLKRAFSSEVVYSKAANADDFKKENGLVKVRELNDLHHAKDAFVNIVVGNVFSTKFNHNAAVYFQKNGLKSYNMKYLYAEDIPGAWKVSEKDAILKTYAKNTCRVVQFTSEGKGQLFNATVRSKKAELIPLKEGGAFEDTLKYGGYESAKTAYFMLVKSRGKKGQPLLSLEAVSIYADLHFRSGRWTAQEFLKAAGLQDPKIVLEKIKPNTLISIDGSYAYLRGRKDARVILCNANQLFLDEDSVRYLKKISNCFRDKKRYFLKELPVNREISAEENVKLYDVLVEKLSGSLYAGLSVSGQAPFLREKREKFSALSPREQAAVLFEILKLMQCNSAKADFTALGGGANCGAVLTSKFIQDRKVKIILQSPTGYYRQVVDCADFL